MLNLDKLFKEISSIQDKLFPNFESGKSLMNLLWTKISSDEAFYQKVIANNDSNYLPYWQSNLNGVYKIQDSPTSYSVLALDGSQIYPDRNLPIGDCFLINIGGILLEYGKERAVKIFSKPKIFLSDDLETLEESFSLSIDIVDLTREELEFVHALEFSLLERKSHVPFLCIFDGSLIFWHLESKSPFMRTTFLKRYLNLLGMFYEHKVPIAGYISFPKSKELVSLLRFEFIENFSNLYTDHSIKDLDRILDFHLAASYLKPYERTTVFLNNSKIASEYPAHLKPCFFYINVGEEIARVEIPFWISENSELLEEIVSIILDQSKKGHGYPVSLSEAHQQAVIKTADREMFYQILSKYWVNRKVNFLPSQKSLKKRRIGI